MNILWSWCWGDHRRFDCLDPPILGTNTASTLLTQEISTFNTHENPAVIASTSTKSSRPLAILLPKKWSVCKSRWPAQRTVVLHATPGWAGAGCRECACSGGDPVIAWQRTPSSRGSDLTRWVVMVVAAANTLSVSGVKWDHLPMLLWPN